MSKKAIIISGGMLEEEVVLQALEGRKASYLIAVDGGAAFLYRHRILPDILVGDFDSLDVQIVNYYREEAGIPIREYNPVKDASDTEIAVHHAIESGYKEILILGATGNRMDHVWANIQVLMITKQAGVEAVIQDAHNRIRLIDGETHLNKKEAFGPYFSVFPLGGAVEQFNIEGAEYPLYNHTLIPADSLCVSNQIKGEEAVIRFPEGVVILMETRD